mmetsp:Transcript_8142/g.14474  ORF Transcript_8142/g.14474 Transcript_8142/m.14474 type:complete len:370 (-) Transcript_8142:140-1249(-)
MSSWAKHAMQAVQNVPREFQVDGKDFDCTQTVARSISGRTTELEELQDYEEQLEDLASQFVEASYSGFNTSIQRFSEVDRGLQAARQTVGQLKKEVSDVMVAMVSHGSTVRDLDERLKVQNYMLQILDEMAEVVGMDDTMLRLIEQQQYCDAVRALDKYEQMLMHSQLQEVRSLMPMQHTVQEKSARLYRNILDGLQAVLYNKGGKVCFDGTMPAAPGTTPSILGTTPSMLGTTPTTPGNTSAFRFPLGDSTLVTMRECINALEALGRVTETQQLLQGELAGELHARLSHTLEEFLAWHRSQRQPCFFPAESADAFAVAQPQRDVCRAVVGGLLGTLSEIIDRYSQLFQLMRQQFSLSDLNLSQSHSSV